ncbi:MAG: molybdopterin-binding protein [Solirubrobacterales bacterium]
MGAENRKGNRQAGDVRAGILVTGNEVVNATVRDENSPWLAEELAALGIAVDRVLIVPDEAEAIEDGLRHLAGRGVDMIITTGGLGPTEDDKTAA